MTSEKPELTEYRLQRLENSLDQLSHALTKISETVQRWDSRMGENGFPMHCAIHNEKITNMGVRLDKMDQSIDEFKAFMYKSIGGFVVVSLIVQLVAPVILDSFKSKKHTVESYYTMPSTNAYVSR